MTRLTLSEQLDALEWTENGHTLFRHLTSFSPAAEGGAVVIAAAALLLAREFPVGIDDQHLEQIAVEFRDLMFMARAELADAAGPKLSVIEGGSTAPDIIPSN